HDDDAYLRPSWWRFMNRESAYDRLARRVSLALLPVGFKREASRILTPNEYIHERRLLQGAAKECASAPTAWNGIHRNCLPHFVSNFAWLCAQSISDCALISFSARRIPNACNGQQQASALENHPTSGLTVE